MKTFKFPLSQALRWRSTQRDLEKARVAAAAAKLASVRNEIESVTRARSAASPHPNAQNSGTDLAAYAAFSDRAGRRLQHLQTAAAEAEKTLAALTGKLIEANRCVRLLENLQETAKTTWTAELNRELESAAAEAHISRLHASRLHAIQSEGIRARSSSG